MKYELAMIAMGCSLLLSPELFSADAPKRVAVPQSYFADAILPEKQRPIQRPFERRQPNDFGNTASYREEFPIYRGRFPPRNVSSDLDHSRRI